VALVLGETTGHLGQSALLAEVFNREDGDAPAWTWRPRRRNGDFIRAHRDWIKACTDLSDGGLALAAFEMAAASGVGVQIDTDDTATLFGEDQGRYLIACNFDQAEALMIAAGQAGLTLTTVGRGMDELTRCTPRPSRGISADPARRPTCRRPSRRAARPSLAGQRQGVKAARECTFATSCR
jgi:phosphoribosylformylglycinamidine (FGAM) synthase-like enzyme